MFSKLVSEVQIKDLVALTILFLQLILLVFVVYKAQKRPDFDVARFLRDENDKESAGRAFAFICLAVMSWGFAMLIFLDRMTEYYFFIFGGLWAGTPVAMEMVKKWNGAMPFGSAASYNYGMNQYPPYPPQYPPRYPPPYPLPPDQQGGVQTPPSAGGGKYDDPHSSRSSPGPKT